MANFRQFRVLIVDDEENFLASMRRSLHDDFDLVTTKDPMQALKIFQLQGPFAVVISDYQMPLMNGVQLFSQMLSIDKNAQRILLTGYANLQVAIDAVNQGKISSFLRKPIPVRSIRFVIMEAIKAYKENSRDSANVCGRTTAKPASASLFSPLTLKEKEVLVLLSCGFSNKEISVKLNITIGTVKGHVNNILTKLGVNNRTKAVARAIELDLIRNSGTVTS